MRRVRSKDGKSSVNKGTGYRRVRQLLCILLSFLISLLFVSIALLTVLKWSFSLNDINRVMVTCNYYDSLLQEIEGDAGMITLSTGLPIEVLEGVFQINEVQEEVNLRLQNAYSNQQYQPDLDIIKSRLKDKVEYYLEEKSITPDDALSQSINDYINSIANEYQNSLRIPLLDRMLRFIADNHVNYYAAISVLLCFALIMMFAIYKLSPFVQSLLLYSYNSTLAAALILAYISKILMADRLGVELQKAPNSLNNLLLDYIEKNLHNLFEISVVLTILSLALLLAHRISKSGRFHSG